MVGVVRRAQRTGSSFDCSRSYCTQPLSFVRLPATRSLYSSLNFSGSATCRQTFAKR